VGGGGGGRHGRILPVGELGDGLDGELGDGLAVFQIQRRNEIGALQKEIK